MFFLSCTRGNGVIVSATTATIEHGERWVGKSHGHLVVLRRQRGVVVVVPEDGDRVDGRRWKFIGECGRGMDGGGGR